MPAVFRDWDMDDGSVEDHRQRHKKVMVEMTLTIFISITKRSLTKAHGPLRNLLLQMATLSRYAENLS